MSENLKIGDELCSITFSKNHTYFTFAKIKRITKTQIILENDNKLRKEAYVCNIRNTNIYTQIGSSDFWQLTTPEIFKKNQLNEYKKKVENWFRKKEFTFEEKEKLYKMFNQ